MDSEPPSLVDEGLRIARQYGLGADFESELEDIKKATTAAAAAQEAAGVTEETDGSTTSNSAWNNGDGMADDGDAALEANQSPMTT